MGWAPTTTAHLLDEVLGRLDLFNRAPPSGRGAKQMLKRAAASLPGHIQRHVPPCHAAIRAIMGQALRPCPEFAEPEDRARQCYLWSPTTLYMAASA